MSKVQIKISKSVDAPPSLHPGELAYSYKSGKLFIGPPGHIPDPAGPNIIELADTKSGSTFITQNIQSGDIGHSPSSDAVFNALKNNESNLDVEYGSIGNIQEDIKTLHFDSDTLNVVQDPSDSSKILIAAKAYWGNIDIDNNVDAISPDNYENLKFKSGEGILLSVDNNKIKVSANIDDNNSNGDTNELWSSAQIRQAILATAGVDPNADNTWTGINTFPDIDIATSTNEVVNANSVRDYIDTVAFATGHTTAQDIDVKTSTDEIVNANSARNYVTDVAALKTADNNFSGINTVPDVDMENASPTSKQVVNVSNIKTYVADTAALRVGNNDFNGINTFQDINIESQSNTSQRAVNVGSIKTYVEAVTVQKGENQTISGNNNFTGINMVPDNNVAIADKEVVNANSVKNYIELVSVLKDQDNDFTGTNTVQNIDIKTADQEIVNASSTRTYVEDIAAVKIGNNDFNGINTFPSLDIKVVAPTSPNRAVNAQSVIDYVENSAAIKDANNEFTGTNTVPDVDIINAQSTNKEIVNAASLKTYMGEVATQVIEGLSLNKYVFTNPSMNWLINHSKNTDLFQYDIFDDDGTLMLASANIIDGDNFVIELTETMTGYVVVRF